MDEELQRLVTELSAAEKEHLDEEGPLRRRLIAAVRALCQYANVPHLWDTEP